MKKSITNYEQYLIYDTGDVLNTKTGKMLDGAISENGYRYYRLSKNNIKKMFYAHRLVAEHFLDNPDNLPVVNHLDGNKLNNNLENLQWVSYSDNIKHAHENGLIKKRSATQYYTENLPNEEWKKIPYYSNYSISSCGRVKNDKTNRILKPSIVSGYYKIRLSNNGKVEDFLIHKLVYLIFNNIDIYCIFNNKEVIDHIDANKLNNSLNNLRLVSLSENVLAGLYKQQTNSSAKKVQQFDLEMNYIQTFCSVAEAAKTLHLDSSTISKVCRGKNKTHGGFIFRYENEQSASTTILK